MDSLDRERVAKSLNEDIHDGWSRTMGMRYVRADANEVVAELEVDDRHRQPYGIVHGGVHCGMIESAASVGAALVAMPRGQSVVGVENHTSFLRAAREGRLRVTARPLSRGRSSQVWDGEVRDEDGVLLATGRVRVLCMDAGKSIAGKDVELVNQKPGAKPG